AHYDAVDPHGAFARVAPRLRTLLRAARKVRAFVNFDMESYETKNLTHEIFRRILTEPEFCDYADVGIVVQCYLRDAYDDLVDLHEWVKRRGTPIWVRLVKGAYWDYETILSQQHGWPIPVFQQKWESDASYERCTEYSLQAYPHIVTALGSHNLRSIAHGIAFAQAIGLPNEAYEVQMLYGMADEEKQALVDQGRRVRVYMPYGELIPGMAYLVRRLLENTSNDSFLKAGFSDRAPLEELLMNPVEFGARKARGNGHAPANKTPGAERSTPALNAHPSRPEFENEPPADFARAENRDKLTAALSQAAKAGPKWVPLWIDGKAVSTEERFASHNPSHKQEVVGHAAFASKEHVLQAVAAAKKALPGWAQTSVAERAGVLRKIAAALRYRRFEISALIVREAGKPWREADGDVCEAIDFCEFYALQAEIHFGEPHGVDVAGEQNRFTYAPRGVTAIIAPWNFPLAILTGMTTAALVAGNPVCVKPAEQSPVTAGVLSEIIQSLNLPAGVFNFLPGDGPTTGAALVEHPDVAMTVFTGSRAVGLAINAKAAEVSAQSLRPLVKRVVAEMGGKNAIIIDDDADLDEAVIGVAHSAFGYAGQKCSACSRVIVLEEAYDAFLERLVEASRALAVGPAEQPGTVVGPVIDEASFKRVHEYIALGRKEGREALAVDVGQLSETGWFVGPHIFADVAPNARLAQEEVFGPVLAVLKAKNL
ncbi:MAG TPA: bifunctional proline dehydrogenase/L-glutamate gamma-semialdehyde dehydrogenase, partial [Pirellulales bacterium]